MFVTGCSVVISEASAYTDGDPEVLARDIFSHLCGTRVGTSALFSIKDTSVTVRANAYSLTRDTMMPIRQ